MKSFESQFLSPELKQLVDTVVPETFESVKKNLIEAMQQGNRFDDPRHIKVISEVKTIKRLQQVYYSYILAAENNKAIK
jgi:hypothetical protein